MGDILLNKNIVIFTKTNWNEPPRLRHQLAKLLLSYGHQITFFEKTNLKSLKIEKYTKDKINFIRHYELLHHQLKPFNFLIKLNQFIIKYFIKNSLKNNDIDLIINFNYDYDFLRELFPNKKVITIINDDFTAQAKPWMKKSIKTQLASTCQNSDIVLTVSYPLQKQIKEFDIDAYIFFPWAEQRYVAPTNVNQKRDTILFWGYIDHRVDWDIIQYLLDQNIKLRFIGNIQSNIKEKVEELRRYNNFEVLTATSIDKIRFNDICCSVLPYDLDVNGVKAISISNRAFQLLSYGIPLIYSDLPELINAPTNVISRSRNNKEYLKSIEYFKNNFSLCQNDIEVFLCKHYSEQRYKLIMDII